MGMLETCIWLSVAVLAYIYVTNRVRNAVKQIRFENAVRQAVEEAKRKRKIDLLYGRNNDD